MWWFLRKLFGTNEPPREPLVARNPPRPPAPAPVAGVPVVEPPRSLRISGDHRLQALPDGLRVETDLIIRGCPRLASLPADLHVGRDLRLIGKTRLGTLPAHLQVGRDIVLRGAVSRLAEGFVAPRNLALIGCDIRELPAGLRVLGDLIIRRCPNLRALPPGLIVNGGLEARFSSFETLPSDVQIGTYVDLEGSSQLRALPDGLDVPHSLRLRRCIQLERLPNRLSVGSRQPLQPSGEFHYSVVGPAGNSRRLMGDGGCLDVANCARLCELPNDLQTEFVEVANSGLSELPPERADIRLRWRGVEMSARAVFQPESLSIEEIVANRNLEVRRSLFERLGAERLVQMLKPSVIHQDTDPGGPRRLLRVNLPGSGEPHFYLECSCPSTGRRYLLRTRPGLTSCHAAAAWIAGFDNPDHYAPLIET